MTSVSAKFLQGEHQGRGESPSELQSSVVVVKNNEEDDQKIKSTLNSSKQSSQNPTAFTVHHQPFSHHPSNSSSASYNNNPSSTSSYYYSSFFGKRLEGNSGSTGSSTSSSSNTNLLVGGNSGSPSTPLHVSSEMQQDFYRPYSLQTSSHLHHHHGSHSFGPPQPHHIIHHHPNSPSSQRLLLPPPPPPPGCGGDSSSPSNSSLSPAVPSFNQSPSSYNQNSTSSTNNTSTSSANNGTNNHLYNSTPSPSSNESSTYQSAGGFLPPDTYDRLYRPHPTRPGSGPAMPPPTSTPTSSPNSNSPSVVATGSSAQGRSQFQRVISSPPGQQGQTSGSASSSLIMSNFSASSPPGAALSPTPAPATPKFRYPSGPSGASPRTTTPSSTLSSREGTPLPSNSSDSASVSAPNVDISRVHLDEFFHNNYSPSSSSSSSTPTRGAAAIKSEFPATGPPQNCAAPSSAFSTLSHYNSPGFLYGPPPQQFLSNPAQQCITLTQRTVQQMRSKGGLEFTGAPRGRRPGSSNLGSGGANVKIGRRPAHLPKNLKFDDKTLPPGWVRKLKQRKHGKQAGRWDVYIYSPCGVKFASRKKLKSFFEKNNLNYDPEDFDFTPYGRHLDAAARANSSNSNSGGAGSSSSSSNNNSGNNNASNAAAVMSNHNPNNSGGEMVNSGRHNSSGSTGSEGTHEGSSPASLQNCSPTHPSGGGHLYSNSSSSFGSLGSHLSGAGNSEYNYPSFDPLMENPPNASALDVPPPAEIYNHRVPIQPHLKTDNSGAGILSPGYFPMEMAEILGDNSLNGTSSSQQGNTPGEPPSLHPHQLHQLHHHHHTHHGSGASSSSSGAAALNSFSDLRSRMLGGDGTELEDPSLSGSGPPSRCVVSLPSESSLISSSGTNKMRAHLATSPNNASTASTTANTGLGPPAPPEMPPIEKTFSIRNTISLLESGNDPYTTYNEYD